MRMYDNYRHMIDCMKNTWQVPDRQTVYEHCVAVRDRALDLYDYIVGGIIELKYEWKIPEWVDTQKEVIRIELLQNTPRSVIDRYTYYHDCGKPLVAEFRDGKMHFTGHEWYSEYVYKGFLRNDRAVIRLIKNDMLIHRSKANDVEKLKNLRERMALLIVSLSEVHANAELFGGLESDSFKMKWKKVDSRGKALLKLL
jgi:hypothetical protein